MIRPTRTTGGIAVLALAAAALTIVIESPAAVIAAGSLPLFLLWRAGRFERDLAALASSVEVSRDVDKTILRQGAEVHVQVRVNLTSPPGMRVGVRDLPPAVAAGEVPFLVPGNVTIYTLRLLAPGKTAFGGVLLSARDTFFSRDLVIRRFDRPELRIFPIVGTEAGGRGGGGGNGDTEVDRNTSLDGQSVRGFRPYRTGDDPGLIDWKVSARRGTAHIRQMTGLEGGIPFIAIDLQAGEGDEDTSTRFSMAVFSAVEGVIQSHEGCSILVIAGGEIVRFFSGMPDREEVFSALGGLAPVVPQAQLYRAPGPAILAARARVPAGQERAYRARLGHVLTAFAHESRSPFADAVAGALAQAEAAEVHLYTLAGGDTSHLVQFVHIAKTRGMRVVLRAPAGTPDLPGADAVEVI